MKLLSVIKNAFAKMNEMLNKCWKWVGDYLVDTMTGEIMKVGYRRDNDKNKNVVFGFDLYAHKYTWKERIFFSAKATLFGTTSVTYNLPLRESFSTAMKFFLREIYTYTRGAIFVGMLASVLTWNIAIFLPVVFYWLAFMPVLTFLVCLSVKTPQFYQESSSLFVRDFMKNGKNFFRDVTPVAL
jgi:hypothetical protein